MTTLIAVEIQFLIYIPVHRTLNSIPSFPSLLGIVPLSLRLVLSLRSIYFIYIYTYLLYSTYIVVSYSYIASFHLLQMCYIRALL